jgi:hypothetical protein
MIENLIKQIISERTKQKLSYKKLSIRTRIPVQRLIELEQQTNYILIYNPARTKRYVISICEVLSIKIDSKFSLNKKKDNKKHDQYNIFAEPSFELIYITVFLFILTLIIYSEYIDTDSIRFVNMDVTSL